jgi:hypothetical protein
MALLLGRPLRVAVQGATVDHADYLLADVMGRMRSGCSARATSSHEDRAAEQRNQLAPPHSSSVKNSEAIERAE